MRPRARAERLSWFACIATAIALSDYVLPRSGVHHTYGALASMVGNALLLALALLLGVAGSGRALRLLLWSAVGVGFFGLTLAAAALHAWLLVSVLAFAVVACLMPEASAGSAADRLTVILRKASPGLLATAVVAFLLTASAPPSRAAWAVAEDQDWAGFNGDLGAQKFSPASQITPQNVHSLRRVWEVHTSDVSTGGAIPPTDWSATPLVINDRVYVSTPLGRVFAIMPDTGRVVWIYRTNEKLKGVGHGLKSRGVAYWAAAHPVSGEPCQKIIYVGGGDGRLHAIDADTGRPCLGFGRSGVLDVNAWAKGVRRWPLALTQPPIVFGDTLFFGWAGRDWDETAAQVGSIFAVDARSGSLKWSFHTLPPSAWKTSGTANVWASMSIDAKAGVLYAPVSSPSPDFYGGARKEPLRFADSVTALDVRDGRVIWSRQLVHHDLWDYDVGSPPLLVDLRRGGGTTPALVQATKQGFLFVLDRRTGAPLFPIEERPAPASDVPGEAAAPTQPYVSTPAPVTADRSPGVSRLADVLSLGECSRTMRRLRYEGRFTPPSLGAGSLIYPGTAGGVEWGGGSVDPTRQTYVVNSSEMPMIVRLLTRRDYESEPSARPNSDFYPMRGSPYGVQQKFFLNRLGMPCSKPPYGLITAYDLNTGQRLWRRRFGAAQKWGFYFPKRWGSPTLGGPLITKSGLIFIGASMDSRVRAISLRTGAELWSAPVEAPSVANPAVYAYRGRQYVLFTVGGNHMFSERVSDQLVAFALP